VQAHLRAEFDHVPAGDIRLISLCAAQGRDVIGVLSDHPRRDGVRARLVELDERNAAVARQAAQAAGLDGVEVLQPDAGITDALRGRGPPQIVPVCGIFGNITVSDVQVTVAPLPSLYAHSELVLWTKHRMPRVSEVLGLTRADTQLSNGAHVRTIGKGRKERVAPLTTQTVAVLKVWMRLCDGEPHSPCSRPATVGR
jgi:hypothetical protein